MFKKWILISLGSLCVILATLGIFLPLLPTTPLLLLAAACYVRSSEKLYNRLLDSKWFGEYIRNYRDGKGIPLKAKIVTIIILWCSIAYSFYLLEHLLARIVLVVLVVAVTALILSLPTMKIDS